jgi:hypothetical protein
MTDLEPIGDVSAGDWIVERLPGLLGTVASVVPPGFAAYARVLHPVEFDDGRPPLTWTQVCQRTGRIPHALMQWAAIVSPTRASDRVWHDGNVEVGCLSLPALGALIDVLAPVTREQDCLHALWEGWGWIDGSGVRVFYASDDGGVVPAAVPEPGVAPDVWALPRLRLPGRDYLLFRGPLRAALNMGWHGAVNGFAPQSPSLFWPADRSWCVGTEIDFDSTLVGGSEELIAAVVAAPGLDVWRVEPDGDLTASADLVNTPGMPRQPGE